MVPAIEHAGVKNARNTDRNADMISFIENTSFVFWGGAVPGYYAVIERIIE